MPEQVLPPFPSERRRANPRKLAIAARAEHLSVLPIFAECSKRQLRSLASATRSEMIDAGQVLLEEGRASAEAYVIIAGTAVVRSRGRQIAELGPGDFVGEMGLLLHRPHSATVVAVSALEVLVLPQAGLRQAVDEVPGLGWTLLQTFADRIAENAARDAERA